MRHEIADRNRQSRRDREAGFLWLRAYSFWLVRRQVGFTQSTQQLDLRARDTRLHGPQRKRKYISDLFIGQILHVIEHKRSAMSFIQLSKKSEQRARIDSVHAVSHGGGKFTR